MEPRDDPGTGAPSAARRVVVGVVVLLCAGWALAFGLPLIVAGGALVTGLVIFARGVVGWAVDNLDDDGWDDDTYREYWGVAGWPVPEIVDRPRRPIGDEIEDWLRDNT